MAKSKEVYIKIGNVNSRIFGFVPDEAMDELYEKMAFKRKDIEYSPKVIDGKWDGYVRLFSRYKKVFPTGLISIARQILKNHGFKVRLEDQRVRPEPNRKWRLLLPSHMNLYDFQEEAVYLAKKTSRGNFSIATGGGKTLTFAAIVAELCLAPTIIYVPSLLLLYQTQEELQEFIRDKTGKNVEVGVVGDGVCDIKDITVMTVQTAVTAFDMEYDPKTDTIKHLTPEQIKKKNEQLKKKKRKNEENIDASEDLSFVVTRREVLKDLINNAKVVICDEAHRASASIYQEVLKRSPTAFYRFALSATMYREDNTEMLIQGVFGRNLLHVSCSELIRRPDVKIVRPYIFLLSLPEFQNKNYKTYAQIRKNCIVKSDERNKVIVEVTEKVKKFGPTLLMVGLLEHGKILEEMIPGSIFIQSKDTKKKKQQALDELMSGEREVVIASPIIDEGLNLPKLKALILCDSGKAMTKLNQRVGRVVRQAEGKDYGIVVDFKDKNEMLAKHASRRESIYLMENEWIVTNVSSKGFTSAKGV